jgi:Spy/CpxP family protein refolding chaperone
MQMKKINISLIALAALLLISSSVIAQWQERAAMRGKFHLDRLAEELKLSEQQVDKLKDQRFALQKNAIDTRARIQTLELELRQLMDEKTVDENQVIDKITKIGELRTVLRVARVKARLETKKVLTDEQLEKLQTLRKEKQQQIRENRRGPNQRFRQERPGGRGSGGRDFRRQPFVPDNLEF